MKTLSKSIVMILFMTCAPMSQSLHAQTPAAAPSASHIALYRQLMDLNGVSENVNNVAGGVYTAARTEALQKLGKTDFSATESVYFAAAAGPAIEASRERINTMIARTQSGALTDAEIQSLINANSTPAAKKFQANKLKNESGTTDKVQAFMVDAVIEIIKTFNDSTTVPIDPEKDIPATADKDKIILLRQIFKSDGTEALTHKFVGDEHMRLILDEVAKHIDFSSLSVDDKTRLAAIATQAQTELETRVLNLNAMIQSDNLTRTELTSLLVAYETDAQKKLTDMRLKDDGTTDQAAETDLMNTKADILKAFEAKLAAQ